MPRPRLLFLSHLLPYPPDSGAAIRTFNVLRLLARDYDIVARCFYRADASYDVVSVDERLRALAPFAETKAVPVPQHGHVMRKLWDHGRSVLTRRAFTYYAHHSAEFDALLDATLARGRFDLAHVDSLDLTRVLPRLSGFPVVCTHHNVESDLIRRRARATRSGPVAAYLRLQAAFTEGEERRWLSRVALNLAVSTEDEAGLRRLAPSARVATVPNGVDTEYFRPQGAGDTGAVFIGGTNWFPNADALVWFRQEILPALERDGISIPLTWIGHATDAERASFTGDALTFAGYVRDIRPHVARAACSVVPLRIGGGTRLKVLDAWAMGKAVVSTSVGCEGLDARDGENILVADTPGDFARAMARLAGDATLRHRLGAEARRTVERQYSWDVIGETLRRLYQDVLSRAGGGGAPAASGRR